MSEVIKKNTKDFKAFRIESVTQGAEGDVVELSDVQEYNPVDHVFHSKRADEAIRDDRDIARKYNFTISDIVKKHRGISEQEEEDRKRHILTEVSRKLETIKEEEKKKSYEEGKKLAYADSIEKFNEDATRKIEILDGVLNEIISFKPKLLKEQLDELYEFFKTSIKWVLQREIKDDKDYVKRLILRMIQEFDEKAFLTIKISHAIAESHPELFDNIEKNLSGRHQYRLEIDHTLTNSGVQLETDTAILNGSLESQFEIIDKIFDKVNPRD